jgi:hemerythrin superfamily protein
MATMIKTSSDVVEFLKQQHHDIKTALGRVSATHGAERSKAFFALRRLMAVHETAEEEIVHPAARRALPNGEALVDARLREENQAKKMLAELEKLDPDSVEFDSHFHELMKDVIAHAEAEEYEELEKLGAGFDKRRLERMRKAAEFAEAVAPTRPHPGVESATANMLIGPFAAMIDRSRDALSRKS